MLLLHVVDEASRSYRPTSNGLQLKQRTESTTCASLRASINFFFTGHAFFVVELQTHSKVTKRSTVNLRTHNMSDVYNSLYNINRRFI